MRIYLYIDSKTIFSADQIDFVTEKLVRDYEYISIIVKFHITNFLWYWIKYRKNRNFKFIFRTNMDILSKEGGVVFYCFNALSNLRLISNRKYNHVFLGHGDSNKRASLNPLFRVYDHVLVSGVFAVRRFVEFGLFSHDDAAKRLVDVGGAAIADLKIEAPVLIGGAFSSENDASLYYLPTWEGGIEIENYTSLGIDNISKFVAALASRKNCSSVIIKPHRNIGTRDRQYRARLAEFIEEVVDMGLGVVMSRADLSVLPISYRFKNFCNRYASSFSLGRVVCAVVDVSAGETMLAKMEIPSIVIQRTGCELFASSSYMETKGKSVISSDQLDDIAGSVDYCIEQLDASYQKDYFKMYECDGNFDLLQRLIDA